MRSVLNFLLVSLIFLAGCSQRSGDFYETVSMHSTSTEQVEGILRDGQKYNFEGLIVRVGEEYFVTNNNLQTLLKINYANENILRCLRMAESDADRYGVAILGIYRNLEISEIIAIEVWGETREMMCAEGEVIIDNLNIQ